MIRLWLSLATVDTNHGRTDRRFDAQSRLSLCTLLVRGKAALSAEGFATPSPNSACWLAEPQNQTTDLKESVGRQRKGSKSIAPFR